MDRSDAELVMAARAGDQEAFGVLITRYLPLAMHAARSMIRTEELARDLAQEAMLHAYLSLESLRDASRFSSWLYGIVLNVCRSHLRAQKINYVSLDALMGGVHRERIMPAEPSVEQIAEERALHQRVVAAINDLSPRNRAAVLMYYYDGLTLPEIAALLDASVTAIKGRLHKSRQSLKEILMHEFSGAIEKRNEAMVQVKVIDVLTRENGERILILLDEANRRMVALWIGPYEADSISLMVTNLYQTTQRPLTYAFMGKLMEAAGMEMESVKINKLQETVFYATATIRVNGQVQDFDTRPSDGIALALHMDAPIYVNEAVMEQVGVPIGDEYEIGTGGKGIAEVRERFTQATQPTPTTPAEEEVSVSQKLLDYVFGDASKL